MKKTILFLLLLITQTTLHAAPFNKVVFFGDSITDNGNLYKLSLDVFPKSPPYYKGRFSNGPTWADNLANHYSKSHISSKNYAVGGATAIIHPPSIKFIAPTTLELEMSQYLLASLLEDKSQTLFVIWIGGNDYLFDQSDKPNELTTKVVARISLALDQLIYEGAKYFLVLNLPDLSRSPFAIENGISMQLQTLSLLHNEKLTDMIQQKRADNPKVKLAYIDVFALLNDMAANTEKYNQRYNANFTNMVDSCWKGGFLLKRDKANLQYFPSIAQVHWIGKLYEQGVASCRNPNEYVFWDQMHPTAEAHRVLALVVEERLDSIMK